MVVWSNEDALCAQIRLLLVNSIDKKPFFLLYFCHLFSLLFILNDFFFHSELLFFLSLSLSPHGYFCFRCVALFVHRMRLHLYRFNLNSIVIIREYQPYLWCTYALASKFMILSLDFPSSIYEANKQQQQQQCDSHCTSKKKKKNGVELSLLVQIKWMNDTRKNGS